MAMMSPSVKHPDQLLLKLVRNGVNSRLPLMAAGGVYSHADAQRALGLGIDMVAIGRAAIGNAQVPGRFKRNAPLEPMPFKRGSLAQLAVSQELLEYIGHGPLAGMNIIEPA